MRNLKVFISLQRDSEFASNVHHLRASISATVNSQLEKFNQTSQQVEAQCSIEDENAPMNNGSQHPNYQTVEADVTLEHI